MSGDIWNWGYTLEILPVLARAAIVTVEATLISFAIAAVLGLVLAVLRMSGPVVGWLTSAFVEFDEFAQLGIVEFTEPVLAGADDGLGDGPLAGEEFVDAETRSRWDVTGRALSGPLRGTQLEQLHHLDTFWFAWATYQPDTDLVE